MSQAALRRAQYQTPNEYLRMWVNESRDRYLATLYDNEELLPEERCSCGSTPSWRCLDCVGMPAQCWRCCKSLHADHPFHRVEFWNGTHYEAAWLRQVGVEISLGHHGKPCPMPDARPPGEGSPLQGRPGYSLSQTPEVWRAAAAKAREVRCSLSRRPSQLNEYG